MASHPIAFAAGPLARGRQTLASVAATFRGRGEPAERVRETYLDTFDWLVRASGGSLSAIEGRNGIVLCRRGGDGSLRHRLLVAAQPAFATDLPESPLRSELTDVIGCRRLLPVVRLDVRRTLLRIEDERGKTVARVVLEHGTATDLDGQARGRRVPPTLEIVALRGYAETAARLARFLEQERRLKPLEPDRLARTLARFRRAPGGRSSKLRLRLHPQEPAALALQQVLAALLDTIVLNEDGVRKDLDREFLHDFRVAVRRTRSALGQVKHVLPPPALEHFRGEFDWLGSATNVLRDLDVHLLGMPDCRAALPAAERAGIDALESVLGRRREAERLRLVAVLDGERYATLVEEWRRFLGTIRVEPVAGGPSPGDPQRNAGRPIRDVAAARIRRAHRRTIEHGRAIDDSSPAEDLHRLRIDCKKLRYLLEFFAGLFDEEAVSLLVKSLKQLQDNLGVLNDLEVQRAELASLAAELEGRATATLLAVLAERRREERERFSRCFAEFDDPRIEAHLARALEPAEIEAR